MTNDETRKWPTREEWAADAEQEIRTQCYPSQRVGQLVTDWSTEAERAELREAARDARKALFRIMKLVDNPYSTVDNFAFELRQVIYVHELSASILAPRSEAVTSATEQAVQQEVARRQTDEAWHEELERRRRIDEYFRSGRLVHR